MAEQQTPEDDQAELRLRALMPLLHNNAYPEFGHVNSTRNGVPSHTQAAAEEATKEVCRRFGAPGGIGITERANAYLARRGDSYDRPNPQGTMWAEVIRLALLAADDSEFVPGLFTSMWKDLRENASS